VQQNGRVSKFDGVLFFLNANFTQIIHFYIQELRGVSHLDDKTLDNENPRRFASQNEAAGADVYKKQHINKQNKQTDDG
jgi:hypothetical protein